MKSEKSDRIFELTDEERTKMATGMQARVLESRRIGFALRGEENVTGKCLVTELPETPAGEVSCCGAKDFLIDEIREFTDEAGSPVQIRCASSAVLEMTDAPIHLHATTLEYYIVLAGSGKMVLGNEPEERIVPVREGSIIMLPPGQAHGIVSDDPDIPVKALLTFSPGLAPKDQLAYRDEQIIHPRTSTRLAELST